MAHHSQAHEILQKCIKKLGNLRAVCNATKLTKSTLTRIQNGETVNPQPRTLGKLMRAANRKPKPNQQKGL